MIKIIEKYILKSSIFGKVEDCRGMGKDFNHDCRTAFSLYLAQKHKKENFRKKFPRERSFEKKAKKRLRRICK